MHAVLGAGSVGAGTGRMVPHVSYVGSGATDGRFRRFATDDVLLEQLQIEQRPSRLCSDVAREWIRALDLDP